MGFAGRQGRDQSFPHRKNKSGTAASSAVPPSSAAAAKGRPRCWLRLVFEGRDKKTFTVVTDDSWLVTDKETKGWSWTGFDPKDWKPAAIVCKLGDKPRDAVNEVTPPSCASGKPPAATPAAALKVAARLQGRVARFRPEGRTGFVGQPVRRPQGPVDRFRPVRPPLPNHACRTGIYDVENTKVEKTRPAPRRDALACSGPSTVFTSSSTEGHKYKQRVVPASRSKDGGDTFEKPEFLARHRGRRRARPARPSCSGPDRKSLYVVCGDMTGR